MRLIVVDGIDGSGKSTVATWIAEHYRARGEEVLVRTHPSDTWFGRMSRRSLIGEGRFMQALATFFFVLDVLYSVRMLRRWEGHDKVIFVRYVMATAYLPAGLHRQGYHFFCKLLPMPERLLLVDTTPECALTRIEEREHEREMFENIESLRKVRRKVLELSTEGWKVLDNSGPSVGSRSQLDDVLASWEALS
ncbi:MAG: thymidylate kinase [Methanomassiliicoccales archaeon]|nr:thymidylate kinase [Methanomassiliicoccales archaeon]